MFQTRVTEHEGGKKDVSLQVALSVDVETMAERSKSTSIIQRTSDSDNIELTGKAVDSR